MKLEAKINNPITLKLSPSENVVILENEKLPLELGAVFSGDHFGFNLIVEKNGQETTTTYPTQCSIYGTQFNNGELNIFEEQKYIPWKFSSEGIMLRNAEFSTLKRSETSYIASKYGVNTAEQLAELNDYRDPESKQFFKSIKNN